MRWNVNRQQEWAPETEERGKEGVPRRRDREERLQVKVYSLVAWPPLPSVRWAETGQQAGPVTWDHRGRKLCWN